MRVSCNIRSILCVSLLMTADAAEQVEQTCVADGNDTDEKCHATTEQKSDTIPCSDSHENCAIWAGLEPSECDTNPNYMKATCPKACNFCQATESEYGENNFGVKQRKPPALANDVEAVMGMTTEYMDGLDSSYDLIKRDCKNLHEECIVWALHGHCDNYPRFMQKECAPTCQTCDQIAYEQRCPMTDDLLPPDAWEPGDLNSMFERIVKDYQQFHPQVLSRPKKDENSSEKDGPWIITLDDFLSPQECERLIELGHEVGYERSWDVGEQRADGSFARTYSKDRTSTTAWCRDFCFEDPVAKGVTEKLATLTQIPQENSEYLQLLKYREGEFYKMHHDLNPFQAAHQPGVRMLTVFLYLNDVDGGGGTNFPKLDITVQPKLGRVVIWPSVLDQNPNRKDGRTTHQALPVTAGEKYGGNAWIHLRDFKGPLENDCQ